MQPVEIECLSELIIHESRFSNSVCNDDRRASLCFSPPSVWLNLCSHFCSYPGPIRTPSQDDCPVNGVNVHAWFLSAHFAVLCLYPHTRMVDCLCVLVLLADRRPTIRPVRCAIHTRFVTWAFLLMEALSLAIMNQTGMNLVLLSIYSV